MVTYGEHDGWANFADRTSAKGIKFRNDETEQEFIAVVHDRYPQMGEVHLEGRHYIEVSVELFVQMMYMQGFKTVDPRAAGEHKDEEGQ